MRAAAVLVALAFVMPVQARTGGHGAHHGHGQHRSAHAKREFKHQHPCPSTGRASGACPGYVIDHVVPLKRGGADAPGNMQWQTREAAKAKDRVE